MNKQCTICGGQIINSNFVGDVIGAICQGTHFPAYQREQTNVYVNNISSLCPITNSSHEKALVRVVDRTVTKYVRDDSMEVIQVLCSCGHILSECEIKNK